MRHNLTRSPRPTRASYATDLLPGLLVLGVGTGLVVAAASLTTMRDATAGQVGRASGLMVTAHEVGAALGVAVRSAVAAGYRHDLAVAATVAAALAAAALLAVPPLRPVPDGKAAVHR
jgi:predicted MFS family arabinose efflux permease